MMRHGRQSDDEIRHELCESKRALFDGVSNPVLLAALRSHFPAIQAAYVLNWIPEQGEDIYFVLVRSDLVATVELERSPQRSVNDFFISSLEDYRKRYRLSSLAQRKLAVALELIQFSS